jgi:hypothetical protein
MAIFNVGNRIIEPGTWPWGFPGAKRDTFFSPGEKALMFNGSSYVKVTGFPSFDNASFTAVGWFKKTKPLGTGGSDDRFSLFRHSGTHWSPGMWYNGNTIRGHAKKSSSGIYVEAPWAQDTEWHFIGEVFDSATGTLRIVLDEEILSGSSTSYESSVGSGDLFIGDEDANSAYSFEGYICGLQFYDIALDDATILSRKNKILTGSETGLVAYYPASDGVGDILRDASGNGRDGTITGATWATSV